MWKPFSYFFPYLHFTLFFSFHNNFSFKNFSFSLSPATLLKKRLRHRCLPANLKRTFFKEHFFTEHPRTTASVNLNLKFKNNSQKLKLKQFYVVDFMSLWVLWVTSLFATSLLLAASQFWNFISYHEILFKVSEYSSFKIQKHFY